MLVVDDSAFMRIALSRMINSESGFEVVATACSGSEALEKIASLDPDVVTLDFEMPGLNGLQTLRCIMNQFPRPVIMVSAVTEEGTKQTFDALASGAFDYVPKRLSLVRSTFSIFGKISSPKFERPRNPGSRTRWMCFAEKSPRFSRLETSDTVSASPPAIVAIGTSTGGPKALQEILPLFPRDVPVPILIVQHLPQGFTGPFAQRLNALCSVTVREATHGEPILPGVVYIAPAGMHMTVVRPSDSRAIIWLDTHPEDCLYIPSVDVLMKSVAEAFRNGTLGVIMTEWAPTAQKE